VNGKRADRGTHERVGATRRLTNLVGGILKRSGDRLLRSAEVESPSERAARLGHVPHGEFGTLIAYDPEIVSNGVLDAIERGAYERFEARRAKSFVDEGARILELGAGLGFLSALILSCKRVEDYQLVEADPRLPPMMRRTHELNGVVGKVEIHSCVATCDTRTIAAGEVDFFIDQKFSASSVLGVRNSAHTVKVPAVSLPALIEQHRSTVLIADIEGAETEIFNGTPLGTIEKILIELHPHRIGQRGVGDVFRNLDRLGYVYEPAASASYVCGFRRLAESGDAS
jgi:FkbM family methyltransferase